MPRRRVWAVTKGAAEAQVSGEGMQAKRVVDQNFATRIRPARYPWLTIWFVLCSGWGLRQGCDPVERHPFPFCRPSARSPAWPEGHPASRWNAMLCGCAVACGGRTLVGTPLADLLSRRMQLSAKSAKRARTWCGTVDIIDFHQVLGVVRKLRARYLDRVLPCRVPITASLQR